MNTRELWQSYGEPSEPCPKCKKDTSLVPFNFGENNKVHKMIDYDYYQCINSECDYFAKRMDYDEKGNLILI